MNELYDLLETSRGPEARQREGALKFIGGPMSPFSSKSVRRKKVKITVTFVRRSKIAERSKHREAMRSRDLRSIAIAKRSKHRESSKHREQRSKHRESSKHREHREAMRSKIAKRCYRSIAKRCYRRSRSDRSIAKRCSRGIADDDAPGVKGRSPPRASTSDSYTHLRAHETVLSRMPSSA